MNKQELKDKMLEYQKEYGSLGWEKTLLIHIGAKDSNGTVKCDYPRLIITGKDKLDKSIDLNGDLTRLKEKQRELSNSSFDITAKIEYFPKKFSEYLKLKREIEDDNRKLIYAREQNEAPTPEEEF